MPKGTIVFAKIGEAIKLNRRAILGQDSLVDNNVMGVKPRDSIVDSTYLYYFLTTIDLYPYSQATTVPSVRKTDIENILTPLPPLAEQRRIVSKMETMSEHLGDAHAQIIDAIRSVDSLQNRVLFEASTGQLTGNWREAHPSSFIADQGSGPRGEDSRQRANAHLWGSGNVPGLTDDEKRSVPECWAWTKVGQLGGKQDEAVQIGPMSMQSSTFSSEGVPVLNVGCVQWDRIDETKLNFMPQELAEKFERYRVEEGDLLFTRSGTVGRCAIATKEQAGYLMTFHLLRVRLDKQKYLPEFLQIVFRSAPHIKRQMEKAAIGTTRAGFNTRLLASLDVPLPALPEQQAIVVRVRCIFDYCRHIREQCCQSQARIDQARTSILKMAFEGKLVPQDPNDEPASVLLEHVKAGRPKSKRANAS